MRKRRHFGITVNDQDTFGGMIVNNIRTNHNSEVAEARDQFGKIIDYAVYNLDSQITIDGLYTGENVSPGSIIVVKDVSYIVTSTKQQEANNTFQTGSLIAVSYPQYIPPTPPTPPEPPIVNIPLTIKCTYPYGYSYVSLSSVGAPDPIVLKAKINDGEWNTIQLDHSVSSYYVSLQDGDIIAFSGANDHFSKDKINYYRLGIGGKFEVSGNIMSLMNFSDSCTDYCFYRLFYNCKDLSSVPKNMLPATNLASGCYQQMFYNCDHLTNAPDLPASTVAPSCYYQMFMYCTSLTSTPQLPATELANHCYNSMFNNCTKLSTAPQLPATKLARVCYGGMFDRCTSLISAPSILPAITLSTNCYADMFDRCTSLTAAPELPATGLAQGCYAEMFRDCISLTSFPDLPATTLAKDCYIGMFWGCSAVVNPPKISATILAGYDSYGCMQNMFNNCSSMISIYLPATTLTNGCYTSMFAGCRSLTSINVDFTEWDNEIGTYLWVKDVAPNGIFYKPSTLPEQYASDPYYYYIPSGWQVVNKDAPIVDYNPLTFKGVDSTNVISLRVNGSPDPIVLKAKINDGEWNSVTVDQYTYFTALLNQGDTIAFSGANDHFSKDMSNCYYFTMTGQIAVSGNIMSLMNYSDSCTEWCYYNLFNNCSSLIRAPELPATTLAKNCYAYMFDNCKGLSTAPELPATTLAEGCYQWMFNGCHSLTAAPYLPATTLAPDCYNYMFAGCWHLSSINVNFTDWDDSHYCTYYWVSNVASEGTFTKPNALSAEYGISKIPYDWTVVNK